MRHSQWSSAKNERKSPLVSSQYFSKYTHRFTSILFPRYNQTDHSIYYLVVTGESSKLFLLFLKLFVNLLCHSLPTLVWGYFLYFVLFYCNRKGLKRELQLPFPYFFQDFFTNKECYPMAQSRLQTLLEDSFILQQILQYLFNCLIS